MSAAIALEDKLHQAVTESANAVVEKDRIGGIWHDGRAQLRVGRTLLSDAFDLEFQNGHWTRH